MKGSKGPTKIKIVIESPTEIITYRSSNVQIFYDIEKHFEKFKLAPWDPEIYRIETMAPTFTLRVQPLGLRPDAKGKDWFSLEFKKK